MRWLAVLVLTGCGFDLSGTSPDGGGIDVPVGDATVDAGPLASPRKLRFDNTASAEALMGFPVLVALTPQTIDYAVVANPATDLRFEDVDTGTTLPFEVEQWVPNGESIVWVRVPQIDSGSADDYVLMHFGAGANGTQDAVGVWASNDVVTHFGPAYANSAGTTHNGSPISMTQGPGQLGLGAVFPGGGNHGVQIREPQALFNGWSQFTLEFWIYGDYPMLSTVANRSMFMDKGTSLNLGRFFVAGQDLVLQIDLHFTGTANDVFLNTRPTPQAWTYVVYTFDGVRVRLYANGVADGTHVMTGGLAEQLLTDTSDFYVGSPNNSFAGKMDELRIAQVARSPDWIRAQHLSMTRAFVTVGDP